MEQIDARIRAFLAVDLNDAVRAAIGSLVERLRASVPDVSWVRAENAHVTLRFLGNVDQQFIEAYVNLLRPVASTIAPFSARVRGVGMFPTARRPAIFWVGLEAEGPALGEFQSAAEQAASALGLEPDARDFMPHVTIGRMRRRSATGRARRVVERERGFDAGALAVDGVSLFSSELTPQGARYTRLHRLTFDGIRGAGGL